MKGEVVADARAVMSSRPEVTIQPGSISREGGSVIGSCVILCTGELFDLRNPDPAALSLERPLLPHLTRRRGCPRNVAIRRPDGQA
jgi:hypothetical protein